MGDVRPDGYDPEPWIEALPGLMRRVNRWRWAGAGEIVLTGIIAVAAVQALQHYIFSGWWNAEDLFISTVILLVAGLPVCIVTSIHGTPRLDQWLKCSGVFDALAWHSPQDSPSLDWLFRRHGGSLGTGDSPATGDWLALMALHLDSLPSRGTALFKLTVWLSNPLAITCIWVFVLTAVFFHQAHTYPDVPVLAYPVYVLCLMSWGLIAWRRFRPGVHAVVIAQYIEEQHRLISEEGQPRRDAANLRMQDLIDRLEMGFLRGNAILVLTAGYLALLPVASWLWLAYQALAHFTEGLLVLMIFTPLVSFVVFIEVPCLIAMWCHRDIVEQLDAQQFLARALSEAGPVPDVTASVPVPLRGNLAYPRMPGGFNGGLAEVLWSIGYNLDWYMKPTPVLVRAGWIAAPVLQACGAILVASIGGALVFNIEDYLFPGLVITVLGLACAMIVIHDVARKHIWTRVFIHYLRKLIG